MNNKNILQCKIFNVIPPILINVELEFARNNEEARERLMFSRLPNA